MAEACERRFVEVLEVERAGDHRVVLRQRVGIGDGEEAQTSVRGEHP